MDSQTFKLECKNFLIHVLEKLILKSPLKKRIVLGATCLNPTIMMNPNLREGRVNIAIEEMVKHNQLTPAVADIVKISYVKFCDDNLVKKNYRVSIGRQTS